MDSPSTSPTDWPSLATGTPPYRLCVTMTALVKGVNK